MWSIFVVINCMWRARTNTVIPRPHNLHDDNDNDNDDNDDNYMDNNAAQGDDD